MSCFIHSRLDIIHGTPYCSTPLLLFPPPPLSTFETVHWATGKGCFIHFRLDIIYGTPYCSTLLLLFPPPPLSTFETVHWATEKGCFIHSRLDIIYGTPYCSILLPLFPPPPLSTFETVGWATGKGVLDTAKALWSRVSKNPDISTGPSARPFTRLLAPLTHLLARALHGTYLFARWLTPKLMGKWMIRLLFLLCFFLFWTILRDRRVFLNLSEFWFIFFFISHSQSSLFFSFPLYFPPLHYGR